MAVNTIKKLYRTFGKRAIYFFITLMCGSAAFLFLERDGGSHKQHQESEQHDARSPVEDLVNLFGNLSSKSMSRTSNGEIQNNPHVIDTFYKAEHLSFTVLFTVGYGYLHPVTTGGRTFCMFYALIGIPITSLMLATAGEIITCHMGSVVTLYERKRFNRAHVKHKSIKIFVLTFILFIFVLNLSAIFLVLKNKWSYLNSFYFWYITFTTIGFGDLPSPIDKELPLWARLLIAIFVRILSIAGVCSLAGVVNSALDILRKIDKKRRYRKAAVGVKMADGLKYVADFAVATIAPVHVTKGVATRQ